MIKCLIGIKLKKKMIKYFSQHQNQGPMMGMNWPHATLPKLSNIREEHGNAVRNC